MEEKRKPSRAGSEETVANASAVGDADEQALALPLDRVSSPRPEILACAIEGDLRRAAELKAAESGVSPSSWLRQLIVNEVGDSRPFRLRRCAESGVAWLHEFEGVLRDNPSLMSNGGPRLWFAADMSRWSARLRSRSEQPSEKMQCPYCDIRCVNPDSEENSRSLESHLSEHFVRPWLEQQERERNKSDEARKKERRPFFTPKRETPAPTEKVEVTASMAKSPEGSANDASRESQPAQQKPRANWLRSRASES